MSMTPSPFDHDSRSRSSLILYSELPICNTRPYPLSLAPHETFSLVHEFAPNSPLNPTKATIPSSVGPLLFKFISNSWRENKGNYSQECFIRYPDTSKFVKKNTHASPRFFNPFLNVWVSDKTLLLVFDIYIYLTNIRRRQGEYCRIIPETKSRGLFDNIHRAWGE